MLSFPPLLGLLIWMNQKRKKLNYLHSQNGMYQHMETKASNYISWQHWLSAIIRRKITIRVFFILSSIYQGSCLFVCHVKISQTTTPLSPLPHIAFGTIEKPIMIRGAQGGFVVFRLILFGFLFLKEPAILVFSFIFLS